MVSSFEEIVITTFEGVIPTTPFKIGRLTQEIVKSI